MIPYIETPSSFIFTWMDGTPRQVATNHKNFKEIRDLITGITSLDQLMTFQGVLEELLTPAKALTRIFSKADTVLSFDEENHVIECTIDGVRITVPLDLNSYIIQMHEEGGNLSPLVEFLRKLSRNPDPEVASQLWGFIRSCGLCLSANGDFLSYKNVRDDYTSIYDGVTDNSPGKVLRMPRYQVQKDSELTCSSGLHFAAWGYLRHYSAGGKTMLISTSPEHVVSIPSDYNNQKGRACEYRIVREVAQPEELKNHVVFDEHY